MHDFDPLYVYGEQSMKTNLSSQNYFLFLVGMTQIETNVDPFHGFFGYGYKSGVR